MDTPVVTVTLATTVFDAAVRYGGGQPVAAWIGDGLEALAGELGLTAQPVVKLATDDAPARGHPVRVDVGRQVCRTSREVVDAAVAYVTGVPASGHVADEQWAALAADDLAEVLALVCRYAVAGRPATMLPQGDPLAEVLAAGRSLAGADLDAVRAEIRADPADLPVTGPEREFELLVEPQYMQVLTGHRDAAEVFSYMREGLFTELGLVVPSMHIRPDGTLRARGVAFRVNGARTLPHRGLAPGTLFVNDTAERLRLMAVDATAATNPATGQPGAVVDADHRDLLEAAGLTTWDPLGYFVLVLAATVRERAFSFLTSASTASMLERLNQSFPAVSAAGRAHLPPGVLTATLRALLRDGVGVRNLRRIIERALRYEHAPEEAGRDRVAFVRAGLADQIGMKVTNGRDTVVAYLLDPLIEQAVLEDGSEHDRDMDERFADAVDAELRALPPTAAIPYVLTEELCRARVADRLRPEFPRLRVISYGNLPPHVNVQPVARISWR